VLNWFSVPPTTIFVVSRGDLSAMTDMIHQAYPWLNFTISLIDGPRIDGYMNRKLWDFVNSPSSSGRWE
jgi:hypothetical protein